MQNLTVVLYMLDTSSLLICTYVKVALLIVGNFILSLGDLIIFLTSSLAGDSRLLNIFRYAFLYTLVIACMSFCLFLCCGLTARHIVGGILTINLSGTSNSMRIVFICLTCAQIKC